ncbi:23S rRNA m(6)A-1618 methyltransferase [Mesonia phycicola]|uniref:Ribosomal RNA large subunit methyltransferase F n=1 Tax=Mesonia phycicola TaxID=579105 RepID=A0A1M6BMH7_9FLAO|nr:23S rRNA (adenine(1618)-N(6))-methyltransferase RlmF [Mesonia phycicola]SHI49876.1 23S rRNA m(6)A-1618 methyltransferase [Mesonia phycicola]
MSTPKNVKEKPKLHPRNKNRDRYDLDALCDVSPKLNSFIKPNKWGTNSIDFSNPLAVKTLNAAILNYYYGIKFWDFPEKNLCPPIPGRAEYIHHIADLLSNYNEENIVRSEKIKCLDIGTGASCIYPVIGVAEYNWNFIATDVDAKSIESAQKIVKTNNSLKGKVNFKLQNNPRFIFRNILNEQDKIDVSICNPPFHASIEDAISGTKRKIKNLTGKKTDSVERNFSGNLNELVYKGGEFQFIQNMIFESKAFSKNCLWFTTLVSKQSNLKKIYKVLKKNNPSEIKTIDISVGNKTNRIVAWTYFTPLEREKWLKSKL